jgi:ribosomal protein L36
LKADSVPLLRKVSYEVEINESDPSLIDHIVKRDSRQYIINKAYICIKEATPENDGTVINLHR